MGEASLLHILSLRCVSRVGSRVEREGNGEEWDHVILTKPCISHKLSVERGGRKFLLKWSWNRSLFQWALSVLRDSTWKFEALKNILSGQTKKPARFHSLSLNSFWSFSYWQVNIERDFNLRDLKKAAEEKGRLKENKAKKDKSKAEWEIDQIKLFWGGARKLNFSKRALWKCFIILILKIW